MASVFMDPSACFYQGFLTLSLSVTSTLFSLSSPFLFLVKGNSRFYFLMIGMQNFSKIGGYDIPLPDMLVQPVNTATVFQTL